MKYIARLKRSAEKQLAAPDSRNHARILVVVTTLTENPHSGYKLKGQLRDHYSIRVWPYRVIYTINKREQLVVVWRILHRQSAYN